MDDQDHEDWDPEGSRSVAGESFQFVAFQAPQLEEAS